MPNVGPMELMIILVIALLLFGPSRLAARLTRPLEAIAVLRPAIRGGVDGSNTYLSRTELHEALAQAERGRAGR